MNSKASTLYGLLTALFGRAIHPGKTSDVTDAEWAALSDQGKAEVAELVEYALCHPSEVFPEGTGADQLDYAALPEPELPKWSDVIAQTDEDYVEGSVSNIPIQAYATSAIHKSLQEKHKKFNSNTDSHRFGEFGRLVVTGPSTRAMGDAVKVRAARNAYRIVRVRSEQNLNQWAKLLLVQAAKLFGTPPTNQVEVVKSRSRKFRRISRAGTATADKEKRLKSLRRELTQLHELNARKEVHDQLSPYLAEQTARLLTILQTREAQQKQQDALQKRGRSRITASTSKIQFALAHEKLPEFDH